jgi:hypothetical protein
MNPDTNKLEHLTITDICKDGMMKSLILRPNGEEIPKHWAIFSVGEIVVLKEYSFKIAYMNETSILLEPCSLTICKPVVE